MTVFICGEEPEDIWSGIYDAWMSRLGHRNVRLEPNGEAMELFCEYRIVQTSDEKAGKVVESIRKKLSERIYEIVYKAALSQEPFRADKIYRFLIYGFAVGPCVTDMLQIPEIHTVFCMNRHLEREYQHMLGFTRFARMDSVLLAKIEPKNDILALLADHFADRMPSENWMIYDEKRKKIAVYQADRGWILVHTNSAEWQERLRTGTDEREFEALWRTFCQSVAITQRYNPQCQKTMLPLRFRPHMTEFQNKR